MELYRVVTDNGTEIPVTKENRREYLSDPQGFKMKHERRIQEMNWNDTQKWIKALSQEEAEKFEEKFRELYEEASGKKEKKEDDNETERG